MQEQYRIERGGIIAVMEMRESHHFIRSSGLARRVPQMNSLLTRTLGTSNLDTVTFLDQRVRSLSALNIL